MKKILEVKNITKIYKIYRSNFDRLKEIFTKKIYHKEFISNNHISFDLYEGETLGIIGVNGAGKSTLLKLISGVIVPSSGDIIKHGKVTALLELGTGFHDEMSGYENIYLNGTLIGMSKKDIDKNIKNIISFSELADYIYEPIRTYSSGMRMRLAFSIAIYSKPDILIVDEALSVGDAHFGAKCTTALKQKKEQNMSIIYVSHDLNSLKLLCDRALLLDNGKLIEQGNPEDVINNYNFLISKLNESEKKITINKSLNDSFGTFDIQIEKVTLKGEKSNANIISSGEKSTIDIKILSKKDLSNMTIGIIIRDRFGQDIFGTNTFHHGVDVNFKSGEYYNCRFALDMNIGVGLYTITAAVHSSDTHLEDCSHWLDNACAFEVSGFRKEQFVGICCLEPKIDFNKLIYFKD